MSPPCTQYSHTTLSNLKLSPLVESCPRSIYSTGTAGRGLGSLRCGHSAPAVQGAPALGPARSSCCLAVPIPHYPTNPTQTSILRGLGQSYRRCRAARTGASTATCCSGPTLHTRRREHAAQSGSSRCGNPGCRRQTKPFPATQRGWHCSGTAVYDRCQFLRTYVAFSSSYYREQAGSSANK